MLPVFGWQVEVRQQPVAVGRHMVERGGPGKIIILSSQAGKQGYPRYAAYCASKFALVGMTQALALEMAAVKVNVNAI